jgi:hypothetical protein
MNQNRRDYLLNLIQSVLNQAEIKSCHHNWVNIWREKTTILFVSLDKSQMGQYIKQTAYSSDS